jgi:rhamnosyltransferase subunit B
LRAAGVNVHEHLLPLGTALSHKAVIVHHGGIGTAIQALTLGRPQLILHRHMEQHFNAHILARLGIAKSLNQTGAADGKRPNEAALFDLPENATDRARKISERLVRLGSINKLMALCDASVD